MKKLALCITALAGLIGTPAFAADMAVKMPVKAPPPAPAPVYSWTGFYVGVNGGYGFGRPSADLVPADALTTLNTCLGGPCPGATSFDVNGGLGGLQAGYNWQFAPTWLAGLEADFQWSDLKGTGSSAFGFGGPAATYFAQQQIKDFGTVRDWDGCQQTMSFFMPRAGSPTVELKTPSASPPLAMHSLPHFHTSAA